MTAEVVHGRLDRFRSRVQEAVRAVTRSREASQLESSAVAFHQRNSLRSLLADAEARSPFHARRLTEIDPESFELADLHRLPILTKAEMMANFDEVLTDRRLHAIRLVTNLYNRVQPLIRYALEDIFVEEPAADDSGHFCAIMEARSDDILRFGKLDYQVHQTAAGIDLSVVVEGRLDHARLRRHVCAALQDAGVTDAVVDVQTVPNLERSPGSGKLRRFVPLASATPSL
jgi:phenylacetate-coenzyme A ligase PaaK-like adenylate-forming protein